MRRVPVSSALMAALMPTTARFAARTDYRPGGAATRLKAWTATIPTAVSAPVASTAIRRSTTTSTVAAPSAIASSTLRALKARTRIAADARGIAAHEFFAGCVGIARRARLARQQDYIVLGNRCRFAAFGCTRENFAAGGFAGNDGFLLTFAFGSFSGFVLFLFGTKCDGVLVFHVAAIFRFLPGFRAIRFGVFYFMLRMFVLFVFVRFGFFFLFFHLFHFGGSRKFLLGDPSLGLLVLRFHKLGRKRAKLFIAQRRCAVLYGFRYVFLAVGNPLRRASVPLGFRNGLFSG